MALNTPNPAFNTKPQLKDVEVITFTNGEKTKGVTAANIEVDTVPLGNVLGVGIGYKISDGKYAVSAGTVDSRLKIKSTDSDEAKGYLIAPNAGFTKLYIKTITSPTTYEFDPFTTCGIFIPDVGTYVQQFHIQAVKRGLCTTVLCVNDETIDLGYITCYWGLITNIRLGNVDEDTGIGTVTGIVSNGSFQVNVNDVDGPDIPDAPEYQTTYTFDFECGTGTAILEPETDSSAFEYISYTKDGPGTGYLNDFSITPIDITLGWDGNTPVIDIVGQYDLTIYRISMARLKSIDGFTSGLPTCDSFSDTYSYSAVVDGKRVINSVEYDFFLHNYPTPWDSVETLTYNTVAAQNQDSMFLSAKQKQGIFAVLDVNGTYTLESGATYTHDFILPPYTPSGDNTDYGPVDNTKDGVFSDISSAYRGLSGEYSLVARRFSPDTDEGFDRSAFLNYSFNSPTYFISSRINTNQFYPFSDTVSYIRTEADITFSIPPGPVTPLKPESTYKFLKGDYDDIFGSSPNIIMTKYRVNQDDPYLPATSFGKILTGTLFSNYQGDVGVYGAWDFAYKDR